MSRADFASQVDVSRETLERLDIYAELLRKWTAKINLVAPSTIEELWTRHFLDSAQLVELAPDNARQWVDLGSGGGFPGAVVAMILTESQPTLKVTLVEADQRKAAFLRSVLRQTGTDARVVDKRAERIGGLSADVLSARALAPLNDLLSLSVQHLVDDGCALFLKGKKAENEVRQALVNWRFDCETHTSKTDKDAVIIKIGDIERV